MRNKSVHMRNRSAQMNRSEHMSNSTPHCHGLNACQMQSSKFCILHRPPVRLRASGMFMPIPLQDLRPIHPEPSLMLSFRLHRRLPRGLLRLNFRTTILCTFFIVPRRATCTTQKEGKAVLLHAWSGLEGSRKLRFPDFMETALEDGKVVSLTHRPHLPPGNSPGTHFCQRLSRPQGHSAIGRIMSLKNSKDTTTT